MDLFIFYPGQRVILDDGRRGTYKREDPDDKEQRHLVDTDDGDIRWCGTYEVHPDDTATVTYDGPGPGWREIRHDENPEGTLHVALRDADGTWIRGWKPVEVMPTDLHRTAAAFVDRMGIDPDRALVLARAVVAAGGFE